MKKLLFFLFAVIFCIGMLAGCSQNDKSESEMLTVYSFCGESDQFTVMNGVIVIDSDTEVFYGGDLNVIDQEQFADIASYSVKFYTMTNGEKRTIMHNSVVDQTSGSIKITGDLGKMSGEDILIGNKAENASELMDNLFFELRTTDLSGEQNTYQLWLTVIDVTE